MAAKEYRFAIIGYGGRGRYHALNLTQVEGIAAQCVAVADPKAPTTEDRERFGNAYYQDYRDLLANEQDLDCVIVASPPGYHVEQALAALERGLPVFLEKAVATSWEDAVRLYRTVIKHQYPLFIGYNLRRFPATLAMKALLDEGKLGRVQSVLAHINTGNRWAQTVFDRYTVPPSTTILIGKLTHDTDTIQHCLQAEGATCTAIATRNIWPDRPDSVLYQGDVSCVTGLLTNGVLYTIHLTTAGPDYERRYTINGDAGQLDVIMHTSRPGAPTASVTLWLDGQRPQAIKLPSVQGSHGGADVRIHSDFWAWLQSKPDGPHEPRSILTGMVIPTAAVDAVRSGLLIDCQTRLRAATE